MADQIVIELIGDPSGLKPAEEALKELSKAAQDNLEAFKKANDAMSKYTAAAAAAAKTSKTFEESAKEVGKAINGITESANKGITAISNLQTVIAGGAIKSATEEIKTYTGQMKTLGDEKEKLMAKLKAEKDEYTKLSKEVNASNNEYKTMSAAATKAAQTMEDNKKRIDTLGESTVKLTKQNADLAKEKHSVSAAMSKLTRNGQGTSQAYIELKARSEDLSKQIDANKETIKANTKETGTLNTENRKLGKGMVETGQQIKETAEKFKSQKDAIAAAKEELIKNAQETAKTALEHNKFYKSLGSSVETLEKMKSVGEAVTSGMKLMGVENKQVEEGMKKLSQALEFAKAAQAAMSAVSQFGAIVSGTFAAAESAKTGAMGGSTVATWLSVAATTALDVALSPIIGIVAAVAAGVALVAAEFFVVYKAGQALISVIKEKTTWFKTLQSGIEKVTKVLTYFGEKARDLFSWLSNGAIDNTAMHNMTEELKKSSEQLEQQSKHHKTNADLLEAEGVSAKEVAEVRKKANDEETEALGKKLKLEELKLQKMEEGKEKQEQLAKIEELRGQLAENMKKSAEDMVKGIEQTVEENKANGMTEEKVLSTKKAQIQANMDLLKQEMQKAGLSEAQRESIQAQYVAMQKMLTGVNTEIKKSDEDKAKRDQDAYAKSLADAKALADIKLTLTQKGSEEELHAKIKDLNAAAAVEINNAKGNAALQTAIRDKLKMDTDAANKAFHDKEKEQKKVDDLKDLEDDKKNLEVLLVLNQDNSKKVLQLSIDLAKKQKDIALTNEHLTVNEKLLIEKQYNDKVEALIKAEKQTELMIALGTNKEELNADIEKEKEILEKSKEFSNEAMDAKKKILADLKQMAIDEANATITNEKERVKKLADIDKQYTKDLTKLDDDLNAHEKENAKKTAKAKEDLDKKMAAEAIKIGQQVSDAIFAAQAEKRKQALDDAISTLETQKTAELASHHLTASQKAAVEKKFKQKEAELKLKAWKADQKGKEEQAIINGALAIANILATMPWSDFGVGQAIAIATSVATTAIQIGTIASAKPPKFAKGVIGLDGPGSETSDSIAAYLSRGESVITAERTKQYKPILEQIQAGIFQPLPIPLLSSFPRLNDIQGLSSAHTGMGAAIDYDKLGRAVAQALPRHKVQKLSFDKKGFSHYLITESGKIESYNNRYKE